MLTEIAVIGPLSAALRARTAARLAQATGPVVLTVSSDGLPLEDIATPQAVAEVAALADRLASLTGSVALLGGDVRGAALELALGATHRIATPDAQMGFSDLAFGLVPGAGGTQRLPRLVGGAQALRLLLHSAVLGAAEALAIGLVDQVAQDDPRLLARGLAGAAEPRRRGFADGRGYLAAVAAARQTATRPAPRHMVDCIEAALLLPVEQGRALERVCLADLAASDTALGLHHAARALQAAGGGPGARVARLGLWGGGAQAVGLAAQALRAGLTVQCAAAERETVVRLLADLAEWQQAEVQAGRLSPQARDDDWARLLPQVGVDGLSGVDLAVMMAAGDVPGPKLSLGTDPVAGVAHLTRLDGLGEVQPNGAAPADLARAVGFVRAMGWVPVVTGGGHPVALRLAQALSDAVQWAEGQGRPRDTIARALAAAGLAGGSGDALGAGGVADEVALRCLAALANAGARAIAAAEAPSALHVDAVAVAAGLMLRATGGPMYQADRRGLLVLRRDLMQWQADDAALWSPAPLLDRLVSDGRGFTSG